MPTLPATGYIENASRTVAETKAALESLRDVTSILRGGAARPELTIASGSVTPATRDHGGHFRIDTEGDAASDDLDLVLQTNTYAGQCIRLYAENSARVVTVKHGNGGAGELLMVDGADFVLDALDKWVEFERRSTSWVEVDRGYGADVDSARAFMGATGNLKAVHVYTSSDTWPKPIGLSHVIVHVVGGGGGGGGGGGDVVNACGGGGGGGGYARKLISASALSTTETVTVGGGGTAGAASGGNGGSGGTSSFGAHCSATGGGGGTGNGSAGSVVSGGAGGAGASGDVNAAGSGGGLGLGNAAAAGGGGSSVLGGGARMNGGSVGADGGNYGGGGAGGRRDGTANRAGGAGGAGIVIVEEYF